MENDEEQTSKPHDTGFAYALCGMLAIMFSVEVLPRVMIDMRAPIIVIAALTGGLLWVS